MNIIPHPLSSAVLSAIVLALLSLPFSNVQADVYTCKDSAGRRITSDRPIADCAERATDVYSNTGILKDQLPGALSPEQKQEVLQQQQRRAKERQEYENIKKEKQYLIAHYPTEQDVEIARQKALDAIDTKIATEKQSIKDANDALSNKQHKPAQQVNDQSDALPYRSSNKDDLKDAIDRSNQLIQRYMAEKANINREFDETRKRYVEIVGADKK